MKFRKKEEDVFPDAKTLKKIRDELSDLNYDGGNIALDPDASEVEHTKYELCQLIAKFKREHNLLQKDLAEKLEIDEPRMSDILRGKIDGFTLERLFGYAEKLYPGLRLQVIAA